MKVVIIEDEIIAAQALERLVKDIRPDFDILTVLQSVEDSVEWFTENPFPDLIFMDIHLADGSSFEIFNRIKIDCPIIFTTAYNEYALNAFEVNSIDYLLKPINKQRLSQALAKFGNFTYKKDNNKLISDLLETLNKTTPRYKSHFLIPQKDKLIPVAVEDIACFYSEFKIARVVCLNGQSFSLDYSLEELSKHIDPNLFFRVNRQYIVAHKAISDISIWFAGKLSVNLCIPVPERILVSKARASEFKSWYTR